VVLNFLYILDTNVIQNIVFKYLDFFFNFSIEVCSIEINQIYDFI